MYIYVIDSGTGEEKVLSLLPHEVVFNKGLPSETILGTLSKISSKGNEIKINDFIPNPVFINFLHNIIAKYGPQVSGLSIQAQKQQKGWVYIVDARCPDPQGRVLPEDIIGAFKIADGRIMPNSYTRNDNHLILSERGLFKLESTLSEYLIQESLKLLEKN